MKRTEIFSFIKGEIEKIQLTKNKPTRITINGIEGTGKTTFASEFVTYLCGHSFAAIHVSIDGFHFNKAHRYKLGRDSAKGYYEDAYNEAAFVAKVLRMSQGTPPLYVKATHDLITDDYLDLPPIKLSKNAVIVTDGCYLFKPVFNPYWDLRVYLKTDFKIALERGVSRDQGALGGYEKAKEKFELRYHAASRRYNYEVNPELLADIVIDNSDFDDLKFR